MPALGDEYESAYATENEELRAALQRTQRQLARSKARTEELVEAVYQAAKDASLATSPVRAYPNRKQKVKVGGEVALVHTTDWQMGKRTDTFNMDTLDARIMGLAEKVAKLTEIQRAAHPVERCVVLFGGDMVEGVTVFPNQAWEVDATLFEQIFRVSALMEGFVTFLSDIFPAVDVYPIHGNHGRLGRKGDFPGADNADLIAYKIAAERNTDSPVTWHLPETWHQHITIGNYRALLIHGDQIRSYGGNLPSYGIVKRVSAWGSGVVPAFDATYVGHFHSFQTFSTFDGRPIYIGNTPESGNEYAREFIGATGHPSQRLQFVDPERGRVSAEYEVFLDE